MMAQGIILLTFFYRVLASRRASATHYDGRVCVDRHQRGARRSRWVLSPSGATLNGHFRPWAWVGILVDASYNCNYSSLPQRRSNRICWRCVWGSPFDRHTRARSADPWTVIQHCLQGVNSNPKHLPSQYLVSQHSNTSLTLPITLLALMSLWNITGYLRHPICSRSWELLRLGTSQRRYMCSISEPWTMDKKSKVIWWTSQLVRNRNFSCSSWDCSKSPLS